MTENDGNKTKTSDIADIISQNPEAGSQIEEIINKLKDLEIDSKTQEIEKEGDSREKEEESLEDIEPENNNHGNSR